MKTKEVVIKYLSCLNSNGVVPEKNKRRIGNRYVVEHLKSIRPKRFHVKIDDRIATVNVAWGDRVPRNKFPDAQGTFNDGAEWYVKDASLLLDEDHDTEELRNAIKDMYYAIVDAWLDDIRTRPDVAVAVESYRKAMDKYEKQARESEDHWKEWKKEIAKRFSRKHIEIGERVDLGRYSVLDVNKKIIGYIHIWDGIWLGNVEFLQ